VHAYFVARVALTAYGAAGSRLHRKRTTSTLSGLSRADYPRSE